MGFPNKSIILPCDGWHIDIDMESTFYWIVLKFNIGYDYLVFLNSLNLYLRKSLFKYTNVLVEYKS
jgi:hypothetical protein